MVDRHSGGYMALERAVVEGMTLGGTMVDQYKSGDAALGTAILEGVAPGRNIG